jgi:hypothetical protein
MGVTASAEDSSFEYNRFEKDRCTKGARDRSFNYDGFEHDEFTEIGGGVSTRKT